MNERRGLRGSVNSGSYRCTPWTGRMLTIAQLASWANGNVSRGEAAATQEDEVTDREISNSPSANQTPCSRCEPVGNLSRHLIGVREELEI